MRAAAEALAWFPAARVEALYLEVEGVGRTSLDLAYHLCVHAAEVLRHLPDDAIHPWVLELLEVYDRRGGQGAIRFMQQLESYAPKLRERRSGVRLSEIAQVLDAFTAGLAGRGVLPREPLCYQGVLPGGAPAEAGGRGDGRPRRPGAGPARRGPGGDRRRAGGGT